MNWTQEESIGDNSLNDWSFYSVVVSLLFLIIMGVSAIAFPAFLHYQQFSIYF